MRKRLYPRLALFVSLVALVVVSVIGYAIVNAVLSTPNDAGSYNVGAALGASGACTDTTSPRFCPPLEAGAPDSGSPASGVVSLPEPVNCTATQIGSMKVGETCYAMSSAVRHDISDTFWLVLESGATPDHGGSATMPVTRTAAGYTAVLDPTERNTTYKPYHLTDREKLGYVRVTVAWSE